MESNNVKDQILADAIRTAIEAEKKIEIQKRIIYILISLLLLAVIRLL